MGKPPILGERRRPPSSLGTAAAIPGSSQRSEGLRSDHAPGGSVGTRPFEGVFSTSLAGGWPVLSPSQDRRSCLSPPKTCDLAPTGVCGRAHSPDIQEATLSRLDSEGSRFRHKEGD